MRKQPLCTIVGLLVLLSSCTEQNKEFSPASIIAKAVKAHGGPEQLNAINSRKEQGTTLIYINDSLFRSSQYYSLRKEGGKFFYQSPAYLRKYQSGLIFSSNGSYSWTQNDGALAPYMQPPEEHQNKKGEDYPYFFGLEERNVNVDYVGTIFEAEETLHRLDYSDEDGTTEQVYFVNDLWLIRKTKRVIETSQGPAEIIRYFHDYRKVSEIMLPFRTESHFPPREVNINLLRTLEINPDMPDSLFEFPQPKLLSQDEEDNYSGSYRNAIGESFSIRKKGKSLFITYPGREEIALLIVDENLLMYRDGIGNGSRMANLMRKERDGKPYIVLLLRDQENEWVKE
ncbi:MAG: hypothetical protein RIM99_13950 [Cyclobacteriaceae bacterium]